MNSDTKIISIIGIITVIIIAVGVMFAGNASQTTLPDISITNEALVREDSIRVKGKDAKVQLVEFADFECPACAMFHPTLKRIKAEYGDKLDFVFRVIPIHSNSTTAASVVLAAREQGKMIEMHDILFEKQEEWTKYGIQPAEVSDLFEKYAIQIGLDVAKFNADLDNNGSKYRAIVNQDSIDANTMGIMSTPTIIVNGKAVGRGAVSYETLKQFIESELNPAPVAATSTNTGASVNVTGGTAQ